MPTKQARVTPVPENHALLKMTAAIKQGSVINIRPWYWFLACFPPQTRLVINNNKRKIQHILFCRPVFCLFYCWWHRNSQDQFLLTYIFKYVTASMALCDNLHSYNKSLIKKGRVTPFYTSSLFTRVNETRARQVVTLWLSAITESALRFIRCLVLPFGTLSCIESKTVNRSSVTLLYLIRILKGGLISVYNSLGYRKDCTGF